MAADVKKVTRATRRYSDREIANFKLSAKAGEHVTKEKATKFRFTKFTRKGGSRRGAGETLEFKNLTKPQLFKLLKKYHNKPVVFKFGGGNGSGGGNNPGAKYNDNEIGDDWFSSAEYDAEEAREHFDAVLEDSDVQDVKEFGLLVFM